MGRPIDAPTAAHARREIFYSMTGAMYAAVAGLKTHMQKLNVIGNNVANANTTAYKAGRTTFMESLYTSVRTGSNGTSSLGGNNPSQIGYGCQIGTIDLDMSTKNYVPTGIGTDLMINGDGFFLVGDKTGVSSDKLDSLDLSRNGRFSFIDGYLVDGQGKVVYGFLTSSADPATGGAAVADKAAGLKAGAVSTQLVPIRLPYAARASTPDASGTSTIKEGEAIYPGINAGGNVYADTAGTGASTADTPVSTGKFVELQGVSIDKTGQITGINAATGDPIVIGYVALGTVGNPGGVTHTEGSYYKAEGGAGELNVTTVGGIVKGKLDNAASTDETKKAILEGSATKFVPNGLESSGTDIATEFSEMITTQRGYQANTRIITVTDSMLEELVNMKR